MNGDSTKYKCPVCDSNLVSYMDSTGLMLRCFNQKCSAQEVFGHAMDKKPSTAFEIIKHKYKKS